MTRRAFVFAVAGPVTFRVADAFRTVPRHLFAPGEPLEEVYAVDSAVVTKSAAGSPLRMVPDHP